MKLNSKSALSTAAMLFAAGVALSSAAWAGAGPKGHGHDDGAKKHDDMGKMMKGDHGHSEETAYGKPGDPKQPSRIVEIKMQEGDGNMSFAPALINVKKGEQIRFKLENVGELDHEIVIATLAENMEHAKAMAKHPGMEHADANAKRLAPKAKGEILWKFTKSGEFDMSCLIPGHREAGMTGKVIVK